MERIGLHFEIQEGKREGYLEEHNGVPEELENAYLESGVGFRKESVFIDGHHVFAYLEVEDAEKLEEFMANSERVSEWNERMARYLKEVEDAEMEEIYRLERP